MPALVAYSDILPGSAYPTAAIERARRRFAQRDEAAARRLPTAWARDVLPLEATGADAAAAAG